MSAVQRDNDVSSIGTKENKRSKGSKALSHKVRVAHMSSPKLSDVKPKVKKAQKLTLRSAAAELNARIDDVLLDLLMRDMIDESFWKFHTKCMHVLGLQRYNRLVIESVDGRNPKHLLAYKLKGALELERKKELLRDKYELPR